MPLCPLLRLVFIGFYIIRGYKNIFADIYSLPCNFSYFSIFQAVVYFYPVKQIYGSFCPFGLSAD